MLSPERHKPLLTMDIEVGRRVFADLRIGDPIHGDESILAGMHKARILAGGTFPRSLRDESARWLRQRGWEVPLFWLVAILATAAHAADNDYCVLYSREITRAYVRATPVNALPNLTIAMLQLRLTQAWTRCLNRDAPPAIKNLPSDEKWVADLWSQIQRSLPEADQVGSKPASAASTPAVSPKPVAAKGVVVQSGQVQQPLCTHARMRTVYNGNSWRCLK
jgi:hypothetical protein